MTPMTITLIALAIEFILFGLCFVKARQPVDPLRPRMISYNLVMIILAVAIMATLAHVISLMTGHQLSPRRGKGIR
jgi:membrane-bound acyltransferase YfiQ involved in biofilm formation